MKQVNIDDAKARLSLLVDEASRGQSFIIAKAGIPLARLVPLTEGKRKEIRFGLMKGEIRFAEDYDAPLPDEILDAFEGNVPT